MRKGIRQIRYCLYCTEQVKEFWYEGRFKGYSKTCKFHNGYINRKREFNSSWNGGKYRSEGYVYLLDETKRHLKGASRYTAEHTIVAEKKYGRVIEKDELVHHLNGIRNDNRSENLVIIKRKGHETWTYIQELQKKIRELEVVIDAYNRKG